MRKLASLLRALIRDDRGIAVAEYGMVVTVLGGLVIGLMTLGTNVNDCIRAVGSLLTAVTGHYY
jgi:Flp pilus assembly pilin Flp